MRFCGISRRWGVEPHRSDRRLQVARAEGLSPFYPDVGPLGQARRNDDRLRPRTTHHRGNIALRRLFRFKPASPSREPIESALFTRPRPTPVSERTEIAARKRPVAACGKLTSKIGESGSWSRSLQRKQHVAYSS